MIYRLQEKKLEKLCNEISVSFHDFSHDIEKNPNIPVFENFANITYRGNEILANSLLPKINNFLKNEKINSN